MREKLIELRKEAENFAKEKCEAYRDCPACPNDAGCCWEGFIADHLLANGVIVLPCKVGTHLWRVTYPYRREPKVTEFVVKNFRTVGKKHRMQIEVQALNVPGTNWMNFSDFKTTREEAEAALKEVRG